MKNPLTLAAALAGIILFTLNAAGQAFHWYQRFPHYDSWMHVLGGFFALFALAAFAARRGRAPRRALPLLFFLALAAGLAWEGYEYVVQGFTGVILATLPDSAGDLAADALGALIGALVVLFLYRARENGTLLSDAS